MTRLRRPLASLALLWIVGCPGPRESSVVRDPRETPRPAPAVSSSGLGFRLADAEEAAPAPVEREVAAGEPLGAEEAARLLARLPALEAKEDDAQTFSMPARSLPPPRPGVTVEAEFPPEEAPEGEAPAATPAGPLQVERYLPDGEVELAPHVSITFSEPMVPLDSIGGLRELPSPATLSPQPEGEWVWLGTRTLVFQPKRRLPMATSFQVTVPAGTRAMSGQTLEETVEWSFATPPPRLVASHPGSQWVRLDPVIFAAFDQAIDPEVMLKSVEVRAGGAPMRLRLATREEVDADEAVRQLAQRAGEGRWLAFRPRQALPGASPVEVQIAQGAKGAEGPRLTTEDQRFRFETFGPLRFREATCGWAWSGACEPFQPFFVEFTNALDPAQVDPSLVQVSPEIPDLLVEARDNRLILRGRTKGRTTYRVTVAGELADVHGQRLGEEVSATLEVGPAKPQLFAPGQSMLILDPAGKREYVVHSVNEPALRVRLHAVSPSDWDAYLAWRSSWGGRTPEAMPGQKIFDERIEPRDAPEELVATSIDLSPALDEGLGHALLWIRPAREAEDQRLPEIAIWIQSTQLGLHAFLEPERLTAWVTELADGTPLDGVEVSLGGGHGSATTAGGLARLPLVEEGYPLVARRGKDSAFLPERWGSAKTFLQPRDPSALRWFVFDDRGTYKPGEEVHIQGWLRVEERTLGGDLALPQPGLVRRGVHYLVRDPRLVELARGTVEVDDQGAFHLGFTLPQDVNQGSAWVELDLPHSSLGNTSTAHRVQVQDFRRPEFAVRMSLSEGPQLVGEHATATVAAEYYAGGGLGWAPVEWTVRQRATSFTPPNQPGFHFGPVPRPIRGWGPGGMDEEKVERWSAQTDAGGSHRLRLDFEALEPPYPLSLELSATVEDLNRQRWTERGSMLVHPSEQYVGLRQDRSFVRAGQPLEVELVVADRDGARIAGRPVEVRAARLINVRRGLEWIVEEEEVARCVGESRADEPIRCSLPTQKAGRHRLTAVVVDERGRRNQSALEAWVLGEEAPSRRLLGEDQLSVIPEKESYLPGEVATVLVVSPIAPAEGVLTMRRQGLVHLERFRMEETATVLQVPLDDTMVPNVEIAVDLAGSATREGPDGEADPTLPRRPAFASAAAQVKILPKGRTLAVEATPQEASLQPGGETTIDLRIRDPQGRPVEGAKVAVIVADEAVLALSGYETPRPLEAFYRDRPADVRSLESRSFVTLAEPSLAGDGALGLGAQGIGGTGHRSAAMASDLAAERGAMVAMKGAAEEDASAIEVREDFSPLALFAQDLRTDASGAARVRVKLPDDLTRYRVMAVASAGENLFGSTESTITARLPLMVRPSAPRFLNFGDRFELTVLLQNQTDQELEAAVVAQAANAKIEGAARRVRVPARDRLEVRFPAAAAEVGTARFQIGVAAPGLSDAVRIELPVHTPATTEAFATYGELDEGAVAQALNVPAGVFPQVGGLEISTSSTQLQALTDAVIYLTNYPHSFPEARASRVLAIAALRDVLEAFHAEGLPKPDELRARVQEDLEELARAQQPDGGWSLWSGGRTWPFTSVHVAHALVRAKEKGFEVEEATLQRALGYLRRIEDLIPDGFGADPRRSIRAYALHVRWRAGDADPAMAVALVAEAGGVEEMPLEGLGWIWPTLSAPGAAQAGDGAGVHAPAALRDRIRRHVANRVSETAGAAHFITSYGDDDWVVFHSRRRTDGVLLEALIEEVPRSSLIPKLVKGLLDDRKAGRWASTQENAFILLALDRYFATYEKVTPDFVARLWLGDRFAGEHAFRGRTIERQELQVPMAWMVEHLVGRQELILAKEGPGRLYYRLGLRYAPTDLALPPIDRGFEVSRTYEGVDDPDDVRRDEDGTWRVRLGARVRVRVSMVNQGRRHHVALVDPLPAGFEPLNPALAVTEELPHEPLREPEPREGPARWRWFWGRPWYEHQNLRDSQAEAFASTLHGGVWEYSYVASATTPGRFVVPPPKAEELYAPETFGRGAQDRVIIE